MHLVVLLDVEGALEIGWWMGCVHLAVVVRVLLVPAAVARFVLLVVQGVIRGAFAVIRQGIVGLRCLPKGLQLCIVTTFVVIRMQRQRQLTIRFLDFMSCGRSITCICVCVCVSPKTPSQRDGQDIGNEVSDDARTKSMSLSTWAVPCYLPRNFQHLVQVFTSSSHRLSHFLLSLSRLLTPSVGRPCRRHVCCRSADTRTARTQSNKEGFLARRRETMLEACV